MRSIAISAIHRASGKKFSLL